MCDRDMLVAVTTSVLWLPILYIHLLRPFHCCWVHRTGTKTREMFLNAFNQSDHFTTHIVCYEALLDYSENDNLEQVR